MSLKVVQREGILWNEAIVRGLSNYVQGEQLYAKLCARTIA